MLGIVLNTNQLREEILFELSEVDFARFRREHLLAQQVRLDVLLRVLNRLHDRVFQNVFHANSGQAAEVEGGECVLRVFVLALNLASQHLLDLLQEVDLAELVFVDSSHARRFLTCIQIDRVPSELANLAAEHDSAFAGHRLRQIGGGALTTRSFVP